MTAGLLLCLALAGAEDDRNAEQAASQERLRFYAAAAAGYKIEVREATSEFQPLRLVETPILNYTNPQRGHDQHGALFVWTLAGRPLCIGSIWSSVAPNDPERRRWIANELHSLAAGPLRSRHDPRVGARGPVPQWSTERPGVTWTTLPDEPAPADKPTLRLVQMRRLLEQFSARLMDNPNETDSQLRPLTQPLYRYPPDTRDAADGALFAFVQGTDPEVLLLIEAVPSERQPVWRYAVARFTHVTAEVRFKERTVWQCSKAEPYVGDQPYFLYWRISSADARSVQE